MQGDAAADGQLGQGGNVVNDAVREVGRRAHEQDRVAVDQAGHAVHVDLVQRRGTGHQVHLDLEVLAGLAESSVCGFGEDPVFLDINLYHLYFI